MQYEVKALPKALKEIKITVTPEEVKPLMEAAAALMSSHAKIEGFRTGKASYDVIKGRFGEAAILEEALNDIVRKYAVEVIEKENIESVGEPKVNVEKAAPGNDVIFTLTLSMAPHITRMPEVRKIKIRAKDIEVKPPEVEKVVDQLRKMQAVEHPVDREVQPKDKVTVDMTMSVDRVTVEGGSVKAHAIYLDEPYYVPGLNEKLHGMKKGETRTFRLKFPKDHFQKMIAGRDVDFEVKLTDLHEIAHPEADEAFAKTLGQESMDQLRDLLRKNLENEAQSKEHQRQEIAVLEELVKEARFEDLPEVLVNAESHKMLHELEHSVSKNGLEFSEYLKQIKKTEGQLLLEFAADAVKRVKAAILIREIGKAEKIEADDKDVIEEQTKLLNAYKDDADTQAHIRSEDGLAYVRSMLRNRKVMEFLRTTCVK
jgi:trigger factor